MTQKVVAALYVDPRGPYPRIPCVDAWDQARDATTYTGPLPVIAHPPCGPWGKCRFLAKTDQDPELAVIAVEQVRRFGGVLEHPAYSTLWAHCGLPRPGELPDCAGGFTIQVNQSDWGHHSRKPTWLYIVGRNDVPPMPPPREPSRDLLKLSHETRRRTPLYFAAWLIELARGCRVGFNGSCDRCGEKQR